MRVLIPINEQIAQPVVPLAPAPTSALSAEGVPRYGGYEGIVGNASTRGVTGADRLGGGDPLAIALSINVGSSMVDVSPLSTIGALCVAAVSDPAAARQLFFRLLAWGFSMTIVAALLCQLFAGALARA